MDVGKFTYLCPEAKETQKYGVYVAIAERTAKNGRKSNNGTAKSSGPPSAKSKSDKHPSKDALSKTIMSSAAKRSHSVIVSGRAEAPPSNSIEGANRPTTTAKIGKRQFKPDLS